MADNNVVLHVATDALHPDDQVVITPLAEARQNLPVRLEAVKPGETSAPVASQTPPATEG